MLFTISRYDDKTVIFLAFTTAKTAGKLARDNIGCILDSDRMWGIRGDSIYLWQLVQYYSKEINVELQKGGP